MTASTNGRRKQVNWLRWGVPAASLVVVVLTGCVVGPDFHRPQPPQTEHLTAGTLPAMTAGGERTDDRAQQFVATQAIADKWWQAFGSSRIDELVDQALKQGPTIATAQAALRQAQELASAQRGTFYPSFQANYSPNRGRVAEAVSSPLSSNDSIYFLHTAQVTVGYVVDVFGGNRRNLESLGAQTEIQVLQLRAARLSLAANVVNAALQEASLREQLTATERIVAIGAQQLKILETQRRLGAAPGAAVYAQEAILRQSEAASAVLKKQLAQQHDLLAALEGAYPGEFSTQVPDLSSLRLPDVPLVLPAALVDHRPDVRAAEAQIHAANAQVGVAVSNMLPQITLTGNFGASSQTLSQLFKAGGLMWSLGANVMQPLFQGGQLVHRKRAAEAQLEQTLAQYQSTVLTAFQNVADALEAVHLDAEQYVAANRQQVAAEASLRIARRQVELGDVSYILLLSAEAAALQAAIAQTQARTSRFSDVVAVYQALGGGWGDEVGMSRSTASRERSP